MARNWRCAEGEIDLVVRGQGMLVFCEVKARSSDRFGTPAEAVDGRKQRRLRALAARFLAEGGPAEAGRERPGARGHAGIRFDVASVRGDRVEVIEAAF